MSRPPRPRRDKRALERAVRKQVERTEKLVAELPGGSAQHPIEVSSASVVETKARAMTCVHCGGTFDTRADRAASTARGVLRELDLVCRLCHGRRTLWFRIPPPRMN